MHHNVVVYAVADDDDDDALVASLAVSLAAIQHSMADYAEAAVAWLGSVLLVVVEALGWVADHDFPQGVASGIQKDLKLKKRIEHNLIDPFRMLSSRSWSRMLCNVAHQYHTQHWHWVQLCDNLLKGGASV